MPPSNDDDLPQLRCQWKTTEEPRLLPPSGNKEVAFPPLSWPERCQENPDIENSLIT